MYTQVKPIDLLFLAGMTFIDLFPEMTHFVRHSICYTGMMSSEEFKKMMEALDLITTAFVNKLP